MNRHGDERLPVFKTALADNTVSAIGGLVDYSENLKLSEWRRKMVFQL